MLNKQALAFLKTSPQTLGGGVYGDVFWNLMPSVMYVPGTELPCTVYVANPTDEDREYMLALVISSGGTTIAEYPIRVDDETWFPVEANSVVSLPGALLLGYSDVALTMSLYEKEQNKVVDTVSTALTTTGTSGLPELPDVPAFPEFPGIPPSAGIDIGAIMNLMITMMIVVMMMKMMAQSVSEVKTR
ncbi:unnamed protein product [marine sediment metagenome]|uniref:Uncharacterized protein n=1 Tax=marine sediment metagenome TaxID=412755 RepID=X1DA00_9ZZZZ